VGNFTGAMSTGKRGRTVISHMPVYGPPARLWGPEIAADAVDSAIQSCVA